MDAACTAAGTIAFPGPAIGRMPCDACGLRALCFPPSAEGALVPRVRKVIVDCLNEHGEAVRIEASGWYARILQHEIDHLDGSLYIDRMNPRSFMTTDNFSRHWKDSTLAEVQSALGLSVAP